MGAPVAYMLPGQFLRFMAIGAWNTVFGYTTYAFCTAALDKLVPCSYLAGSLLSSIVNISVAFLGYKWFVFRTEGNYLREWGRCFVVSGTSIAGALVLLPVAVTVLRRAGVGRPAPYVAGGIVLFLQILYNFFGYKNYTFRCTDFGAGSQVIGRASSSVTGGASDEQP